MPSFEIDDTANDWRRIYPLFIGFINPRPIALVSSISAAGVPNLAPFNFYNMVSARPPVVMFAPGFRRDGSPKDTLRNVRETREFCIATVTEDIVRRAVDCAAEIPASESEFDFSGLTPIAATRVGAPRVAESPVNIECRLHDILTISEGPGGGSVVLGRVVAVHVDDRILTDDGQVDPLELSTVGRLGGKSYCTVRDPYELSIPRPGDSRT